MGLYDTPSILEERDQLARLRAEGYSLRHIATPLDRPPPWSRGGRSDVVPPYGHTHRPSQLEPLPRKIDLTVLAEEQFTRLGQVSHNTPRKCLGYQTPAEIFRNHLLHFKYESTFLRVQE